MSLAELRRAVALVERTLSGARVERVVVPDERRVVLGLHAKGSADANLLLCAEPATARLSCLAERPAAPPSPPVFAQLLRARLGAARLTGAELLGEDRQALLRFAGEAGEHALLLALLGPRSNAYLLDAQERVVGALRPLAATRRDLALGEPWCSPPSAPPPAGEDRFASVPDEGFFAAFEAAASEREACGAEGALRARLERALRRALQSLEKKRAQLEADAGGGEEARRLRREGELLKGVVGALRPGAREARARDFASGEEVVIALDPAVAPRVQLDERFRRARKAEKRALRALRELGEVEARAESLAALQRELDEATAAGADGERLRPFAERPEVARLLARFAPAPERAGSAPAPAAEGPAKRVWRLGKHELSARQTPRVYTSADGLEIWVGRNDESNDLLSTRLARGNDLFFHLDASPGSHVVLRTEGRPDPPSASVLDACELAVHFSKARHAPSADVLVAPVKNVRKPRGAKPGLVFVTGGRHVRLRRDPARLARLLRAEPSD
ncbi:MAG: NFACT RNA binding domain-containing protein [Deltaproteobacteria bacterium]|nr:NFACT RNA binding domain-containing protein [Deltaproteobacteria bacterium]